MAHKTLIDGTAYEISGGKTLVNGTAYSIKNGKTLVDGTIFEVGFGASMAEVTIRFSVSSNAKGKSAAITITSEVPFAPIPSVPDFKVTTYSFDANGVEPITLNLPVGAVIACSVDYYQSSDAGVYLNGSKVANKNYIYTITRNASISLQAKVYNSNSYGIIKIVEQ